MRRPHPPRVRSAHPRRVQRHLRTMEPARAFLLPCLLGTGPLHRPLFSPAAHPTRHVARRAITLRLGPGRKRGTDGRSGYKRGFREDTGEVWGVMENLFNKAGPFAIGLTNGKRTCFIYIKKGCRKLFSPFQTFYIKLCNLSSIVVKRRFNHNLFSGF